MLVLAEASPVEEDDLPTERSTGDDGGMELDDD